MFCEYAEGQTIDYSLINQTYLIYYVKKKLHIFPINKDGLCWPSVIYYSLHSLGQQSQSVRLCARMQMTHCSHILACK